MPGLGSVCGSPLCRRIAHRVRSHSQGNAPAKFVWDTKYVGARSASDFGFRAQSALSQPGQCICKVCLRQNCVGARSASDFGFRAQCVLSQLGQCICKVCLGQNYVGARSASDFGFRAQCVLSQPGQCICKVCLGQNYVGARSASEWPKKDPRGVRPPRVKKTM